MEQWSSAYDRLKLGGKDIPGVAHVSVKLTTGVDLQKPRGRKKAKHIDDGDKPARIDIDLELLPEEYTQLQQHVNILRPRGKKAARDPLSIVHPKTAFWGIDAVSIGEIHDPAPGPGETVIIKIEAYEWVSAPPEVNKPTKKPKDETDTEAWQGIPFRELPPSQSPTVEDRF